MRSMTILALVLTPLATTTSAGGISGFTMPHLTWPSSPGTVETPTRDCSDTLVLTEADQAACAQQ